MGTRLFPFPLGCFEEEGGGGEEGDAHVEEEKQRHSKVPLLERRAEESAEALDLFGAIDCVGWGVDVDAGRAVVVCRLG